MASKYDKWIHVVSNRRFIVAQQKEDGRWYSKNTEDEAGAREVIGASPLDLVAKKVRTYANWNAAVKAFRRVYSDLADLPENEIRRGRRV
jgi:hypothetical protein